MLLFACRASCKTFADFLSALGVTTFVLIWHVFMKRKNVPILVLVLLLADMEGEGMLLMEDLNYRSFSLDVITF